jgi:transcriptional regulator with XRE-family HTH domain
MSSRLPPRLREYRERAGWSQAELARAAGVSRPLVGAVESGRHTPSVAAALALARTLGTSAEELFGDAPAGDANEFALPVLADGAPPREGAPVRLGRVGDRQVWAPLPERGAGAFGFQVAEGEVRGGVVRPLAGADLSGFVCAGCEPAMALLADLQPAHGPTRLLPVHATSARAGRALADARCHAAFVHGRARDLRPSPPRGKRQTGKRPPGKRQTRAQRGGAERSPEVVVRRFEFARWWAGLAFPENAGVTLESVASGRSRLAQREATAGTQRALDRALRGIDPEPRISGPVAEGHLDAARRAFLGATQAALTIEPVARTYDLEFQPLEEHRVELWIAERWMDHPGARALLEQLTSPILRARLDHVGGYDLTHLGRALS